MALDEPKEEDQVFQLHGLTYVVDTNLMDQASPIKVDFREEGYQCGFAITSKLSGQSGCGGSCSC
jgi:iron-sulfur cluster assembly protein